MKNSDTNSAFTLNKHLVSWAVFWLHSFLSKGNNCYWSVGGVLQHLTEGGHLESLTEAVILQHSTLAGLAQGTAEEYYILAAQQLDCYGQETFLAKVPPDNSILRKE